MIMGFYQKQPVNKSEIEVTYLWTGLGVPGVFSLTVQGDAQNYSTGFDLVRDTHFTGGLKVDVMGWTGPMGKGTTPYKVSGSFPGMYSPQITVSGANGDFTVPVKQVPHDQVDEHVKQTAECA